MPRLLLTLRFIGTHYHGWQVQKRTYNEAASGCHRARDRIPFERYRMQPDRCRGAYSMYCCTTDTDSTLYGDKMVSALNAHLPREYSVYDCREMPIFIRVIAR